MSESFWWVETDTVSNEHLDAFLIQQGIVGSESEHRRRDSTGTWRDVREVPGQLVTKLRRAKRLDDRRVLHQFKFYTSHSFDGTIRRASFLEKPRTSKKVRDVAKQLAAKKQSAQ